MDNQKKIVQACRCFFALHTLARNMSKYVDIDRETGQPISEEVRRLLFYVREIDRHNGRDVLRGKMGIKKYEPKKR